MEPKKPVIQRSFKLAAFRSLIHVFPIAVPIALIVINLKNVYIAPDLSGRYDWTTAYSLAAFQVAAKFLEIIATASLATIVFDLLRHQLLYKDGLPLALVGQGFTYQSLGFLRTRSTWMGIKGKRAFCIRILLVATILGIALVNLVVAPASAVLILPRVTDHTVWTPDYWLVGTPSDLWLTNLTIDHIGDLNQADGSGFNSCSSNQSTTNERCISMAYQKVKRVLDDAPNMFHVDWQFTAREPTFERVVQVSEHYLPGNHATWTYVPHAGSAYVQDQLWWDTTWWLNDKINATNGSLSTSLSKSAGARTACLEQIISLDTTTLDFPLLSENEPYVFPLNKTIKVDPSLWTDDGDTFLAPSIVRTPWIPRSDAQSIGSVTTGLVVMEPVPPNATQRKSLACSVDARWIDTVNSQADGLLDIAISAEIVDPVTGSATGAFSPIGNSWTPISADEDWLNALLPSIPYMIPDLQLSQPSTTLANLLMSSNHAFLQPVIWLPDYGERYGFWEFVISTLFADAISRVGFAKQLESNMTYVTDSENTDPCVGADCKAKCKFNGSPFPGVTTIPYICRGPPPQEDGFTKQTLQGKLVNVYAYSASATTDYLAITVLALYIVVALAHLLYTIITGRTSKAWEKLEDLVALALSSQSTHQVLANTCAGIDQANTRALIVRIIVPGRGKTGLLEEEMEESEQRTHAEEEVQMVVNKTGGGKGMVYDIVQVDRKYGKMN